MFDKDKVHKLRKKYISQSFSLSYWEPLYIAHGTEDTTVLFSEAEELRDIYETNQIPYIFYELTGAGHGPWNTTVNGLRLEKLAFDFIIEQQQLTIE